MTAKFGLGLGQFGSVSRSSGNYAQSDSYMTSSTSPLSTGLGYNKYLMEQYADGLLFYRLMLVASFAQTLGVTCDLFVFHDL
uniref:AW13 n=1 Tax=Sorghum bicolor TaxID=4558 RepID=O49233_SORBI|nr:AW13 [Sorghum bicolor]